MPHPLDALIEQLKTGAATNEIYGVSAPSSRSRATVEKVLEEAVDVLAGDGGERAELSRTGATL